MAALVMTLALITTPPNFHGQQEVSELAGLEPVPLFCFFLLQAERSAPRQAQVRRGGFTSMVHRVRASKMSMENFSLLIAPQATPRRCNFVDVTTSQPR